MPFFISRYTVRALQTWSMLLKLQIGTVQRLMKSATDEVLSNFQFATVSLVKWRSPAALSWLMAVRCIKAFFHFRIRTRGKINTQISKLTLNH